MSNLLKNLRDRLLPPHLLKWKLKPRLLSPSKRTELIEIFVRGVTWGIVVDFLAIFILYLFVPSISLPLGKIVLYSLLTAYVFYLSMRYAGEEIYFQIDNKGIKRPNSKHYHFLWKGAIGYSLSADEIFFVGKGGRPYHILLPSEPVRSQLLSIIKSHHLTVLSSNQIAIYSVPIVFTAIEVIFLTVFAFCNSILVSRLLALGIQFAYSIFAGDFFKPLISWSLPFCLPTSVLAIIHTRYKYPQFEFFL